MARLLDPKRKGGFPFEYRDSANTDIAATFRRVRKAQADEAAKPRAEVTPLKARKS